MYGRVVAVTAIPLGDEASTAASIGASVLYVDDVADFNEAGGWLQVNGVLYEYLATDDDAASITLAATLSAAVAEGDAVNVWDPSANSGLGGVAVEYEADVEQDDGRTGDPLQAGVDHALVPLLQNAIRRGGSELVELAHVGDDLRVVNVRGKEPEMHVNTGSTDGGYKMYTDVSGVRPRFVFDVGATREQPSIQSDTVGAPNMFLYSGANGVGRNTEVFVGQARFTVGIEETAGSGDFATGAATLDLERTQAWLRTSSGIGPGANSVAKAELLDAACFFGFNNVSSGTLRGFQYINSLDNARILSKNNLEVTGEGGAAYQGINASAFVVSSDARSKSNHEPVTDALAALSGLTVTDYDTPNGAPEGETVRARGVVAQDVRAALGDVAAPEMTLDVGDPTLGVDLYALLATAVAAIQELTARVQALEAGPSNKPKGAK